MEKREYRVPDMHCPNCKMKLESLEDELPGVIQIYASYHQQIFKVEFDDRVVSESQIMLAAEKIGYKLIA